MRQCESRLYAKIGYRHRPGFTQIQATKRRFPPMVQASCESALRLDGRHGSYKC